MAFGKKIFQKKDRSPQGQDRGSYAEERSKLFPHSFYKVFRLWVSAVAETILWMLINILTVFVP